MSAAVEGVAKRLTEILQESGYQPVSPPILQPLEVFLEYAGEDIRRRLYSVADIGGGSNCLRPDLTIPTCRHYLASPDGKNGKETRLCYRGPAFRYHSKGSPKPSEFLQAGAEYFGGADAEEADAEIMSLAIDGLRRIGCDGFEIEVGDLNLFNALADSIAESSPWGTDLKQAFHQSEERFAKLLRQASSKPDERDEAPPMLSEDALQQLEEIPEDIPLGGRSIEEIKARFLERMERRALPPLPDKIASMLQGFVEIRAPFPKALEEIRQAADAAELDITAALDCLHRRAECLRARGIDLDNAHFSTGFGRRLGYYTGFVFELRVGEMQIAAGGRYDHLAIALGSERAIAAVGYAARPDRIAALYPEVIARLTP